MKRNIGFYVTHKTSGQRIFLEKQLKWGKWYFSADGWSTQATSRMNAIRAANIKLGEWEP